MYHSSEALLINGEHYACQSTPQLGDVSQPQPQFASLPELDDVNHRAENAIGPFRARLPEGHLADFQVLSPFLLFAFIPNFRQDMVSRITWTPPHRSSSGRTAAASTPGRLNYTHTPTVANANVNLRRRTAPAPSPWPSKRHRRSPHCSRASASAGVSDRLARGAKNSECSHRRDDEDAMTEPCYLLGNREKALLTTWGSLAGPDPSSGKSKMAP
ncbi:hypothetical protein B0H19DRAFT_1262232 [Mycena capillaripes]|nr:hypothetical protein B0H19DRAFT_1262232 [Mycena capillaripes]